MEDLIYDHPRQTKTPSEPSQGFSSSKIEDRQIFFNSSFSANAGLDSSMRDFNTALLSCNHFYGFAGGWHLMFNPTPQQMAIAHHIATAQKHCLLFDAGWYVLKGETRERCDRRDVIALVKRYYEEVWNQYGAPAHLDEIGLITLVEQVRLRLLLAPRRSRSYRAIQKHISENFLA